MSLLRTSLCADGMQGADAVRGGILADEMVRPDARLYVPRSSMLPLTWHLRHLHSLATVHSAC